VENKRRILVTGACGNLGLKLSRHLRAQEQILLTPIDVKADDGLQVLEADLSSYDATWVKEFEGQEVIVHMAADPRPDAPWPSLQKHNVDATINVYAAAVAHGVKRVVFASSCQVMFGYSEPQRVTHESMPRPVNFYGATKVFGERLGKRYAEQYGLSTISLRIGTIWRGENAPTVGPYHGQRQWLSNRDFCQAVEKAIFVRDVSFAALFVTSNNTKPLWDLSETISVLDFHPQDTHNPIRPSQMARIKYRLRKVLLGGVRNVRNHSHG